MEESIHIQYICTRGGGYEIQLVEVSQICITQSISTKNKTLGWVNFVSYKPSKQEDG